MYRCMFTVSNAAVRIYVHSVHLGRWGRRAWLKVDHFRNISGLAPGKCHVCHHVMCVMCVTCLVCHVCHDVTCHVSRDVTCVTICVCRQAGRPQRERRVLPGRPRDLQLHPAAARPPAPHRLHGLHLRPRAQVPQKIFRCVKISAGAQGPRHRPGHGPHTAARPQRSAGEVTVTMR